jgi:hypothetical protein
MAVPFLASLDCWSFEVHSTVCVELDVAGLIIKNLYTFKTEESRSQNALTSGQIVEVQSKCNATILSFLT